MGYTKEQLEQLFPDKLEFSKFQINRVAQRNFLTQKVMNVVGMDDGTSGKSRRIAGSKDSEYILQKNANGWTLALQNNKDGVVKIDVDETQVRRGNTKQSTQVDEDSDDDDDDWETVPIEKEKTKEETPELPEALQGFESQVLRNQLYDKLKQKAEDNKPKSSFFVFDEEPSNINEGDASEKLKEKTSVLDFSDDDFDNDNFGDSIFSKNEPDDENKITAESDKKDTEKKKKVEVLPPWFIKDGSKADGSEVKTPYDKQSLDDDELIPFDQIHREENLPVYASESEDESEILNPVIIDNSSDDSDFEEVEVNPKTDSNIMLKAATSDLREPIAEELKKPDSNAITDNDIKRLKPSDKLNESATDDIKFNEKSNDISSSAAEIIEPIPPVFDSPKVPAPSLPQEKSVDLIAPKYSEEHENELAEEDFKFAQQEEEELLERIEQENEENERFAQELNLENQLRTSEEFDLEINTLKEQAKKDQRDSDEVTQAMVDECQELLRRFGIPYITAPMEAEAQCAMLMELSLVDGIVTDDSDCFLFGGKRIFKNMFSQNKYVECYDATDLEREFGLDRNKYINLALLLGSDYTDGVTGIGPVTAMEILAEFDSGDSLAKFKEWWEKVQLTTGQRSDEVVTEFKRKFKKSSATKIFLPDKFPDPDVREAYLHPEVDKDTTPFEWGTPDLDSIRTFMKQMVGWMDDRTDQVLVPVIKDMNRKIQEAKQSTINDFFLKVPTATKHTGSAKSSRMKRAMERLGEKHKSRGTQKRTLDDTGSGVDSASNLKLRKTTED
jgi:DNA excision repair protein ERCC-5